MKVLSGRLGRAGRGRADRSRRRGDRGRRAIAAIGTAAELGEGEHHDGCVIVPGFVNAHSHIEYAVYAGFGDGLPFVPWIGMHVQRQAGARLRRHGRDRDRSARTSACAPGSRRSATAASRARRPSRRPQTGLRAIAYLEVFSSDGAGARAVPRVARADRARALGPRAPRRLAPRPVHVHDRRLSRLRRARPAAGDAFRRERSGAGLARRRRRRLDPARGVPRAACRGDRHPPARGARAARPAPARGPLRPRRREEIALLAAHGVGRRALPPLERVSRLRGRTAARAARRRHRTCRSRPTAPPRPRRSTSSRRSARRSSPHGRASAGRTPSRRRTRSSSRRSAAHACSGSTTGIGSLVPGKQADLDGDLACRISVRSC